LVKLKHLLILIVAVTSGCDIGADSYASREPVDLFYVGDQRQLEPSTVSQLVSGGFTDELFTFRLRPLTTRLSIPKNHLAYVTHHYQPWAKTIYDKAIIVAMLPNFAPRSEINAEALSTNNTGDNITILFGELSGEYGESDVADSISKGRLIESTAESTKDVKVYRTPDSKDVGVFWVSADPNKFRSPMGKHISFICGTSSLPDSRQLDRCRVKLALPPSEFVDSNFNQFGGMPGVQLEYYFSKKYLANWAEIHQKVIEMARSFIATPASNITMDGDKTPRPSSKR